MPTLSSFSPTELLHNRVCEWFQAEPVVSSTDSSSYFRAGSRGGLLPSSGVVRSGGEFAGLEDLVNSSSLLRKQIDRLDRELKDL